MHIYQAYGLRIASEIELPELTPTTGSPDVHFRLRRSVEDPIPRSAHAWGDVLVDRVPDVLSYFSVAHGREIVIAPLPGIEAGKVRGILLGMLMAALLRQRGILSLHACCVARDGRAVAFVGDTGWGKSTLADVFHRHGYAVLNDDVLGLDTAARPVTALPGYPQIKLRPNPNAEAHRDFGALPALYEGSRRRVYQARRDFPSAPIPLAKVYLLLGTPAPEHAIEDVPRQQAFLELVYHTRMKGWFKAPAYQKRHFEQCKELLAHVPVARLLRERTDEERELDAMVALVADDLPAPASRSRAEAASLYPSSSSHPGPPLRRS